MRTKSKTKRGPGRPRKHKVRTEPLPLGRPHKPDKALWGQITCVLKHETIRQLRAVAKSRHFGDVLQEHLEKYPLSRQDYLTSAFKRAKKAKAPVIIVPPSAYTRSDERQARRQAREEARKAKLTPEQRAWEDRIEKIAANAYAENRA
jgi:hypothetical protein